LAGAGLLIIYNLITYANKSEGLERIEIPEIFILIFKAVDLRALAGQNKVALVGTWFDWLQFLGLTFSLIQLFSENIHWLIFTYNRSITSRSGLSGEFSATSAIASQRDYCLDIPLIDWIDPQLLHTTNHGNKRRPDRAI